MTEKIVVIDNGGATCKIGLSGDKEPAKVLPNYIAKAKGIKKPFIADQVDACDDIQGLSFRRPVDRGYVVNWDTQREIWDRAFNEHLKVKPTERSLVLTEPPFTLPAIQRATDEVVFEEYGFQSYCTAPPAELCHLYQARAQPTSLLAKANCSLVLDTGFSFTHAVPVVYGHVVPTAIRRINLGGKVLTNYLKELVSYRAWNVMDETFLMEDVKERLCLSSLDVVRDLSVARKRGQENFFRAEYVLPDGVRHRRGYLKDPLAAKVALQKTKKQLEDEEAGWTNGALPGGIHEKADESARRTANVLDTNDGVTAGSMQAGQKRKADEKGGEEQQELTLTNERFMVPEMLFQPADLGIIQAGLAECIVDAVSACPEELHPILYSSIVLAGGSTKFPFFKNRLERDLRPLVPDEYALCVVSPEDPVLSAWQGGSLFAKSIECTSRLVTKKEYDEYGSQICRERFRQGR